MSRALIYAACAMVALWGVAHLLATRGVVAGLGELSADSRLVITMDWTVEGVAVIAIAAFVAVAAATQPDAAATSAVNAVAVAALLALAGVSFFTGFRIAFLPFRLCPFVLASAAALIAGGASW